jgi:replicative DNA helicase
MDNNAQLFDQEAEEYVIGGCLSDWRVFDIVSPILKADDFYLLRHRQIFQAMSNVADRGEDTDVMQVMMELKQMGDTPNLLDEIGGMPYLMKLDELATARGKHFYEWALLVKDRSMRCRILKTTDDIRNLSTRTDLSIISVQNEVETKVDNLFKQSTRMPARTLGDSVLAFNDRFVEAQISDGESSRLYTTYSGLDNPALIGGFKRGDLIIIGGDSGMGKTSLAVNFAYNFARQGLVGLFISKEMGLDEMSRRFLAVASNIPLVKMRTYTSSDLDKMSNGFKTAVTMTPQERETYANSVAQLKDLPLMLKHIPDPTPLDVWTEARLIKNMYGRIDFIIVDQLTDMRADDFDKCATRAQELGLMAGRFKEMADTDPKTRGLNCTVFVLSQIKPSVKQRQNKRPVKGDFQDSTAIGNQADVQLFFYRDIEYNPETETPDEAEILVRKHRDGATGVARLHWTGATTKLRDMAQFEQIISNRQLQNL